jgi:hypothetical protein
MKSTEHTERNTVPTLSGIYRGRAVQVLETNGSQTYVKDGNRTLWVWTKQVELIREGR